MAAQRGDNHESNQSATHESPVAIKLVIDGKGKLGLLTGETWRPSPTDVAASQKWQSENSFITSCLINSMKSAIGKTYMFLPMEKDVWDVIWETYSDAKNASQVFELKIQLWQMKQGNREVTEYYTEMLVCASRRKWENKRVFEFLTGLNRELDDARSRVLSHRPLPSIQEVFSKVRREESRRRVILDTSFGPEASALLSRGLHAGSNGPHAGYSGPHATGSSGPHFGSGPRQSKRTYCEHCKKLGHTKDTCWILHGKDLSSGKTFGSAKEHEDLYYFDETDVRG
ncbi:hypothetical protein CK203_082302 [Vitis vinifera]|uniref:Retrotransposon gag domain-containing protein n=1 Tax=Vitis vinifera TaxID=29760 RepID=A0A438EQT6_VITVI|nr:hypothetical protein CK203_082302 [Vitis vinifera]